MHHYPTVAGVAAVVSVRLLLQIDSSKSHAHHHPTVAGVAAVVGVRLLLQVDSSSSHARNQEYKRTLISKIS